MGCWKRIKETGDAGCVGKVVIQLGWKIGSIPDSSGCRNWEWFRAVAAQWNEKIVYCGLNPCVILDCVLSLFKTQFYISIKQAN